MMGFESFIHLALWSYNETMNDFELPLWVCTKTPMYHYLFNTTEDHAASIPPALCSNAEINPHKVSFSIFTPANACILYIIESLNAR